MSSKAALIFCRFWTLGANREAYKHQAAVGLADKYNLSPEGVSTLSQQ
jgi:hypothetical protein